MNTTWRDLLLGQLDFYWQAHLWPRLQDLTDAEYLWEPVAGARSLRRGDDDVVRIESVVPEPPVPPITTIAWRIAHVGRDVFGKRARAFFGGSDAPPCANMFDNRHWPEQLPLTAAGGLGPLKQGYILWREGISELEDESLLHPLGERGGPFAQDSMAALAVHLNRELMAHGAEVCLLRDLYRARVDQCDPLVRAIHVGEAHLARQLLLEKAGTSTRLSNARPSILADAASLHHWNVVRALVERGFPLTSTTETGTTALHYAAAAGERELAQYLVEHGADPAAVESAFGFDPAGWAEHFGHAEVSDFLRSAKR